MLYKPLHLRVPSSVAFMLTDLSVTQYDPLVQPALLRHEIQSSPESQATIAAARFTAAKIIAAKDDRLIVIVGPCSIHSTEQAIEYAQLLKAKMPTWSNLHIIMRVYFEVWVICTCFTPLAHLSYYPTRNPVRRLAGKD
jgi:phospho-2-dehydro-3-deoxyheptonate aldolase